MYLKSETKEFLKNPFNYSGGKYKLLPQLSKYFPNTDNINIFIDLFVGGGDVSFNIVADKIICNDKNAQLIDIYKNMDDSFISEVDYIINEYELNKTNKEGFLSLRQAYNQSLDTTSSRDKAVMLYALLCHSFNNQIAFNRKGEFNTPFGLNRSEFNYSLRFKVSKYINKIKNTDIDFVSKDFTEFDFSKFDPDSTFIYVDPPYLISTGAYERSADCKWSEEKEQQLYMLLDTLNAKGYKWALSNVLEHKGKENLYLKEFCKKHNIYYLDKNYKNCSYQCKSNDKITKEVLITNY